MQGKNCSFWNMRISYLNLFNFFFCSCFPSTLALILQYKARSLRWAALLASTCSISFFVLVFPLPSLSFYNTRLEVSDGLHCLPQLVQFLFLFLFPLYPRSRFQEMLIVEHPLAISVFCLWFLFVFPMPSLLFSTAMQFVTNGLQCLPQLVHFLHFLLVSTLPSPKFYTQALDQKENKPRPRAKSQGPKAKGKGPRAKAKGPRTKAKGPRQEGQEPRQKGQGKRAKSQGKRAKGKGPRAKAKVQKGQEPKEKGQGKRAKSQGKRAKSQSKRAKEPKANDPRPAQAFGEITFCEKFSKNLALCM